MSQRKPLSVPELENLLTDLGEIVSSNAPVQNQENKSQVDLDETTPAPNLEAVDRVIKEDLKNYPLFNLTKRFTLDIDGQDLSFDMMKVVQEYNDLELPENPSNFGKIYNQLAHNFKAIKRENLTTKNDKFIYDILDCLMFDLEKITLYPYVVGLPDDLNRKETIRIFTLRGENIVRLKKKFKTLQEKYNMHEISAVIDAESFSTRIKNNLQLNPKRLEKALENIDESSEEVDISAERNRLKRKMAEVAQNEQSFSNSNDDDNVADVDNRAVAVAVPEVLPVQSVEEQLAELNELNAKEKAKEEEIVAIVKRAKRIFPAIDRNIEAEQQALSVNAAELSSLINEAEKFEVGSGLILPDELSGISLPNANQSNESGFGFHRSYAFRSERVKERKAAQDELRVKLQEKIAACRTLLEQHQAFLSQEKYTPRLRALLTPETSQRVEEIKGSVNPFRFFKTKLPDLAKKSIALRQQTLKNAERLNALDVSIAEQEKLITEQSSRLDGIYQIYSEEEAKNEKSHRAGIEAVKNHEALSTQFKGGK